METPNDSQQFDYRTWLSNFPKSELEILFEKETTELSQQSWFKTAGADDIGPAVLFTEPRIVLPFPYPRPERSWLDLYSQEYTEWLEEERMWTRWVTDWLTKNQSKIDFKKHQAQQYITHRVKICNAKCNLNLEPDEILYDWFYSIEHISLTEFLSLKILSPKKSIDKVSCELINSFLAKKIEEQLQYLIPCLNINLSEVIHAPSSGKKEKELSKRQRILIHFYEGGNMVERKNADYNDYNTFCTPKKRLAYSNDSQPKLKYLINHIEEILPNLTEKAKQQADSELSILKLRLTIEK